MSSSRASSLSLTRSGTPPLPPPTIQPDHFFGAEDAQFPPSPDSAARPWLEPDDDPLAHRGIPVFKPTMDEFADFEAYMTKIECWGLKSGIVKVIPPEKWVDALPSIKDQLAKVKIRAPIEQVMAGRGGLFRQQNIEKRRVMSVREWAELCDKEEFRTPGVEDVGLHARGTRAGPRPARTTRTRASTHKLESVEPEELVEQEGEPSTNMLVDEPSADYMSPPTSVGNPNTPTADTSTNTPGDDAGAEEDGDVIADQTEEKPKPKGKRSQPREVREANLAERAAKDTAFLQVFDPNKDWLPPSTTPDDYNTEFCQKLERQYWRNCGFGRAAWYGADTQGSLYTDETKIWNVAHLPSFLSRILPSSSNGLPGVNLPYLYFGMWRATFAWHVEDMDLFSINYIHFGAPKFWYAVPQGRADALEATMKSYFPKDTSECPQFLRHKSFLASPTLLAQSSCRPNFLVQRQHEFVITYPRGYHAGFNLGFNCAESVNFALESWVELGRKAKACQCVPDSVRIDVDQLLRDREAEMLNPPAQQLPPSKRKAEGTDTLKRKRPKTTTEPSSAPSSKVSVTLKLGPKPQESDSFPCCLCVSMSRDGLLRVQDPPTGKKELPESLSSLLDPSGWMAHEECAKVVPETWVDTMELPDILPDGSHAEESRVFGVDAIVKDRWNLKCSACNKGRQKAHGAPIQCTKGKCTKSFHVSCAREGQSGVSYTVLREVEKEVILIDLQPASSHIPHPLGGPLQFGATPGEFVPQTTQPAADTEPRVLKTIKKNEVQLLCNQHNPAVAAAKKANKQDRVRNELLALPAMSRIKIRVSAGVFEVSLLRVIEENKSVEVLWDRGIKREFKWGSVVFGQTDGQTVMQKPSEPAPEPVPQRSNATPTLHVATFPSAASSSSGSSTSVSTPPSGSMYTPPYHYQSSSTMYATGSWPYQTCQAPPQHPYSVTYTYPGYYPATMPTACRPGESPRAQGTCAGPSTGNYPSGASSGQMQS